MDEWEEKEEQKIGSAVRNQIDSIITAITLNAPSCGGLWKSIYEMEKGREMID